MGGTLEERVNARIDRSGGPRACWPWTGSRTRLGYGQIVIAGTKRGPKAYVHRLMYEWVKGSIPEGLEIHHICEHTWCCNPRHLRAVTHQENMLATPHNAAARNAAKTVCSRCGKPYNWVDYRGRRMCRSCKAEKLREWRRRQKEVS